MGHSPCDTLSDYTRSLGAALEERDLATRHHCRRVVRLSAALGRRCKLSERELAHLAIGAELHDIGKIGIPDRVLKKPAAYNHDDWVAMKCHPEIGERLLRAVELNGAEEIACIVRHHHEHFDGSGYPDGIAGGAIPVLSRIISLADCYDAIAGARPYHRARDHEEIMDILAAETGSKHDPELFREFCAVIEDSGLRVE